jgi:chaperone BCS1
MSTTDLVTIHSKTTAQTSTKELWPEPLDTPGVIPHHLTRSAAASSPLLEILQRLLYRLRPSGTGELEKALALLGLYQAIRPIYDHIKNLVLWACTVEITIPESDPVAKEILAWMGTEVVKKRHTHSAMLVTGGMETNPHSHAHIRRFPGPPQLDEQESQDVVYVPTLGTRLFW